MGSSKRSRNDGQGRGGRGGDPSKKRRGGKHWSDPSRVHGIPFGSRGVLVSTITGKETQGGREAINIMSAAYEALAPPKEDASEGEDANEAKDISSLIASEVAGLKDKKKQPFTTTSLGINSLVYLQFHTDKSGPSPSEVVLHICRQAKETMQNNTRFVTRFYPVDFTCSANMDTMTDLAKKVATQYFPAKDAEKGVQFSVELERRAADPKLDKMELITTFATQVPVPPNKVNLGNPEKSIMVNIVKNACGVAVCDDFKLLNRYNIKQIVGEKEDNAVADKQAEKKADADEKPEDAGKVDAAAE